ncbi:exocyst complex component EXO84B-like [Durio zibethinus]|uniref:Exocyst complex component EXO84B-like n=1 Tax=Durio zibethinus TaxID=66656 RepID=A0A6P5XK03_DURZI|nr:exocyst complex component EXO84B-like [Durio zibethinus]
MEPPSLTSAYRFRFRDHNRQEMEDASHSDTSSGMSSISSDLDAETELQSMTAKGIKHLCSELLELKAESDEDFHRNIFSNYSSFVRIFDEVEGMKNELMQLKSQVLTQKRLVKDLIDGIHLKVLSEETTDSNFQESEFPEPTPPSKLAVHIDNISETLDILMLENRVDEAIAILKMEDEVLQRMQFEDSSPVDLLLLYNSMISEKKAMLTLQLTLSAENQRISAAELQNVLVGICRLGDSHLATQLLLKYYHLRLATGIHNLQCSQSLLDGLYVKELAKFVFSMMSQAARRLMMLYGETSPHVSKLIQWAREETKLFVASFNKYVKSSSDITGGLSAAAEAMQFAMSYCSLLKSQRLFLRPYLIKHIRPCMEEVLQIHINHFKKVISMFTATETWVLGRYLISGILSEGNFMVVGQQLEYCMLTNSGWKFLTLLQAIIADVNPLLAIQMEGSILKGLMNLFTEYIAILEKAITFETHVSVKGTRRTSAESLSKQISLLANLSTLQYFFFKIIISFFRGTNHMNSEPRKKKLIDFQLKELDGCILFIQEAAAKLKAHCFQQFINRMMSLDGSKLMQESCSDSQEEPSTIHDTMPSVAFQVLFLELRKVDKLAEDNVFEEDWLMELLRELIEAIFSWIVNKKEIWRNTKENSPFQLSGIISQFVLDMHFLAEIVNSGGYFSKKPLVLQNLVDSAFTSAGLEPKRDLDDGWAKNVATEAIQKLLEIEKMQLFLEDDSVDSLEEEPHENDPVHDESRNAMKDSLVLDEDPPITDRAEVAITTETVMKAERPLERSPSLSDVEDFSVDKNAVVLANNSGGPEDVESENGISKACDELDLQEKTDLPDPSSSHGTNSASELRVPVKEDAGSEADAAHSASNELEDDGRKVVRD